LGQVVDHIIPLDKIFNIEYLIENYNVKYGEIKKKSMSWLLYRLVDENVITRVSKGFYKKNEHKVEFLYTLSNEAKRIQECLLKENNDIRTLVWETNILNQFLNHQLSMNIIFVEVEKTFELHIFEILKDELKTNIFLKPDKKMFNQILFDNIVIVNSLISEAPINKKNKNSLTIEKLIVDIFANKYLKELISKGEYSEIVCIIKERYKIDFSKINRYSARRNIKKTINEYFKVIQGD